MELKLVQKRRSWNQTKIFNVVKGNTILLLGNELEPSQFFPMKTMEKLGMELKADQVVNGDQRFE